MASLRKRLKRAGIVAVFTFGFTALAAVLSGPGPATIVPAIAILGWFILAPAVAIFDLPVIDDEDERTTRNTDESEGGPLEELQKRYAAGEISESEFDRKVQRLLETGADGTGRDDPDAEFLPTGSGLDGMADGSRDGVTGVESLSDDVTANRTSRADDRKPADTATETTTDG